MSAEQERQRRFHEKLERRGYSVLDAYEPGAILWCFASDGEADRGTDSYGDCADCGEPVRWVRTPRTPTSTKETQ